MHKFYLLIRYYLLLLLFSSSFNLWAQTKTVSGKVTAAEDGSALPGVNVVEKGTSNGTITSVDGAYSITVNENATLVFSFVGYKASEFSTGGQSTINVSLESDVTALSEVVVIGYGQVEKRDATGAIATLKEGDFNRGVIASPEQLIQGRMAGVQVTSASGEPGAGVNIRIRGTSSVRSGNNPLFVVDGVPLSGDDVSAGTSNGALGNTPPRNPLNFLNPNDIVSVDVLKDASATAIYGSRGANGVVIITTKSGKSGKGSLDYSFNFGLSEITRKYDLLEPEAFLDAYESFNGAAAANLLNRGANTDWQDEILRTAVTQNHNLSFGGNDATGDYRFSFGYQDQEGIIDNSGLKRYSVRFNSNKKFLQERLTIGTQLSVGDTHDDNIPITNNVGFEGDLFGSALKANPTNPVYVPGTDSLFQPSNTEPNPVAYLKLSKSYTNTLRALGNISAEVKIFEGLSFKTVFGFDRSMSSKKTAFSKDLNANNGFFGVGRMYLNDIEIFNKLWENYFTYDKTLGSNVKLNALLGYSYQSFETAKKDFEFIRFRESDPNLMINNFASADLQNYKAVAGRNSSNVTDELQSYYGRVNLTLMEKLIFTATLRADGSTKFGPGNKYGYFPSGAVKWRVSEEAFLPDAVSDLSLRVGYGVTGNQEIPHNLYQERQRYNDWSFNTGGTLDGGGLASVAFQNPNLKWESTSQFNVGIDYGFANNRVRGSIDYYTKSTEDLLIQNVSAQPAVQPFVWKNLDAVVVNNGIEFVIDADVIAKTDFRWTVSGNIAYNKNEVRDFGGLLNTGEINGQGLSLAFAQRIANNQPLYAYFLRKFQGYDENGITVYQDGDYQQFVGKSPLPKYNGGLTNNLSYKNWDFTIFFSGQFGQYIYNNTANAYFTAGSLANGRNVTTDVPGNGESNLNAPDVSTRFLENGSFVRLQSMSLSYRVNTANTFLSALRFSVTGQNLFLITDYEGQDPEVNVNKAMNNVPSLGIDYGAYPRARTVMFGVDISF